MRVHIGLLAAILVVWSQFCALVQPKACSLNLPCKKAVYIFFLSIFTKHILTTLPYFKFKMLVLSLLSKIWWRSSPTLPHMECACSVPGSCYLLSASSNAEKELNKQKFFITHYFMSIAALRKTLHLSIAYMSILGKEVHSNNIIKGLFMYLRGILINTKHLYVLFFCYTWLF